MIRKIAFILIFALFTQVNIVHAGSTGSEVLTKKNNADTVGECFEGFSRAMFKLNHGLDKVVFEPVAKGYRALPVPIRKGTGNVVNNLYELGADIDFFTLLGEDEYTKTYESIKGVELHFFKVCRRWL